MSLLFQSLIWLIFGAVSLQAWGNQQLVTESMTELSLEESSQSALQTFTGGQSLRHIDGELLKRAISFEVRPGKPVGPRQVLRQRQGLEPLYHYLLRHLIVKFDKQDTSRVVPDQISQYPVSDENLIKVLEAWNEMARFSNRHNLETSIFSLFVSYKDPTKVVVDKVVVEPGPTFFKGPNSPVSGVEELVEILASQMSSALKLPQYPLLVTDYNDAQDDETNILRHNVLGEPLRVVGINQEFEDFLLDVVKTELNSLGYQLDYAWFYGSRVLPRTLAVERFGPQIKALGLELPTKTGHISLDSVREGGLTKLSDIEVLLMTSPLQGVSIDRRIPEDKVMPLVRSALNQSTRQFHIGLKVINTPKPVSDSLQAFLHIAKSQVGRGWLPMPNAYVNFYQPQTSPECTELLVDPKVQIYNFFKELVGR